MKYTLISLTNLADFVFIWFSLVCFVFYQESYGEIRAMILCLCKEGRVIIGCLLRMMMRR